MPDMQRLRLHGLPLHRQLPQVRRHGREVRIFSYGGGVQSTAVLVLASQGKVQYDHFLFANVGEDSEHPDTLEYFKNVAMPFAEQHKLDLQEVRKYRKGEIETVRSRIFSTAKSVPIPMKMPSGAPGNRSCTMDFKIRVVDRWVNQNRNGDGRLTVGLGISTDEIHRARTREPEEIYKGLIKELEYPLIDMRLSRNDCQRLIADAGLPVPPPSSCYFCPFHSDVAWLELRVNRPDLFEDAVEIEKHLNDKKGVWMHRKLIPLDQAIPDQPFLFDIDDMDNCESGYCFT
jgi:hypothetical protein